MSLFSWIRTAVILFVLILAYGLLLVFGEPKDKVQNVFISNISDSQVSISWTTKKPTKGTVSVGEKGTFRDDGERSLKRQGFYTAHHVTISNLSAGKTYKFKIYQGWRSVQNGTFTTNKTLSTATSPNPVYGKVLAKDKKPVIGAIVYFQAKSAEGTASAILSTLTNLDGGWSIDLANLRNADLKTPFQITSDTVQEIVVEVGLRGKVKAQSVVGKDKPWPDIILTK